MAVTVIKNYKRVIVAPKSKKGLIIGVSLLAAAGIGIYVWYLHDKKKKELALASGGTNLAETPKGAESSAPIEQTIASGTNPIEVIKSEPKNVLVFQQWANKVKGASLKEDGIFGAKTQSVWNNYGLEFDKIVTVQMYDLSNYITAKRNPLNKLIVAKYTGSDIFDANVADNIYNKVKVTTKGEKLGYISKVTPTTTGYWVRFILNGKPYKTYSSNLNILA